jgi:hypothetical protein
MSGRVHSALGVLVLAGFAQPPTAMVPGDDGRPIPVICEGQAAGLIFRVHRSQAQVLASDSILTQIRTQYWPLLGSLSIAHNDYVKE